MLGALWCSMQKSLNTEQLDRLLALLLRLRKERGVTQAQLSYRIGMAQSDISKVERGIRRLDVLELRTWLLGLNVTLADFASQLDREIEAAVVRNRQIHGASSQPRQRHRGHPGPRR